jgi:hypothetical protein
MSELLCVSTRKGLFLLEREASGWEIRCTAFLGDSVSLAYHDPRSGRLYAALKLGHFGAKLHLSEDRGASWREIACPAFPPMGEKDGPACSICLAAGPTARSGPANQRQPVPPGDGRSWALVENLGTTRRTT